MKVLISGKETLIDKKDWNKLSHLTWYAGKYVYTQVDKKTMYLHRLILNAPNELEVDHINGNSLDNRTSNLRFATRSLNEANKGKPAHNTSGYKGVSYYKATGKYSAYIEVNQKKKHLGYFKTAEEAAQAYNNAAKEQWGDFAKINFIEAA